MAKVLTRYTVQYIPLKNTFPTSSCGVILALLSKCCQVYHHPCVPFKGPYPLELLRKPKTRKVTVCASRNGPCSLVRNTYMTLAVFSFLYVSNHKNALGRGIVV